MQKTSLISQTDVLRQIRETILQGGGGPGARARHATVVLYLDGGPIPGTLQDLLDSLPFLPAKKRRGSGGGFLSTGDPPCGCRHRDSFRAMNCAETAKCMECCKCYSCIVAVCAMYVSGGHNFVTLPANRTEVHSLSWPFVKTMESEIAAARIESGRGSRTAGAGAAAASTALRQGRGGGAGASAAAAAAAAARRSARPFGITADLTTALEQLRSALVIVTRGGAGPTTILSMPHVIAAPSQLIAFYQEKAALPGSRTRDYLRHSRGLDKMVAGCPPLCTLEDISHAADRGDSLLLSRFERCIVIRKHTAEPGDGAALTVVYCGCSSSCADRAEAVLASMQRGDVTCVDAAARLTAYGFHGNGAERFAPCIHARVVSDAFASGGAQLPVLPDTMAAFRAAEADAAAEAAREAAAAAAAKAKAEADAAEAVRAAKAAAAADAAARAAAVLAAATLQRQKQREKMKVKAVAAAVEKMKDVLWNEFERTEHIKSKINDAGFNEWLDAAAGVRRARLKQAETAAASDFDKEHPPDDEGSAGAAKGAHDAGAHPAVAMDVEGGPGGGGGGGGPAAGGAAAEAAAVVIDGAAAGAVDADDDIIQVDDGGLRQQVRL